MNNKNIITIVLGEINSLYVKKDPVCIPYEFNKLGFNSILICSRCSIKIPGVRVFEIGGVSLRSGFVPLYLINVINSIVNAVILMAKLVPILRRVRPWFVLTYYYPALLPLLYLLGRVLNYYVVVKMDWDGNLTGNFLKVLFRKLMLIALSRFADAVIIESYDAMRKAIEAIPALRGKLRVVYNGWCDELLREFNLGNRERIVLTVARVVRVKGIHDLIRAFAMVANKHKDWVLRIVGPIVDANYYRELMTLVRQHNLEGRVYFLGAISDKELIREYSKASIFVLPSYAESFGIARLEALAHGLPVITTDTGGSEVVMGVGVIIEPGDVASLAYWLDRLMGDDALRYNMGMRARMKAAALTWRFVSTRIISIVNELESLRLKNKI